MAEWDDFFSFGDLVEMNRNAPYDEPTPLAFGIQIPSRKQMDEMTRELQEKLIAHLRNSGG